MTPFLAEDLKHDEGLRLKAYPDPISGATPFTIGYGHASLQIHPGMVWSLEEAEATLEQDIAKAVSGLDSRLPWWRTLSAERQDVFVNAAFNLGVSGFLGFKMTLLAAKRGDFDTAAAHMLGSLWARQVPNRAQRLAEQMKTGVRVAP